MIPLTAGRLRAPDLRDRIAQIAATGSDASVINSTDPTLVAGLILPVVANATYALDGYLAFSAGTTGDIKFALDVPTETTGHWGVQGTRISAAGKVETFLFVNAFGEASTYGNAGLGAGTGMFGILNGYIATSAWSGFLQMLIAQAVTDSVDTTLKAGSWIRLARLT